MPIQRPTTVQLRASLYEDAQRIVEAEYDRALALDEVAHRVATSRRQLQRAYAEVGGTTFRAKLAEVRMRRAAEMLAPDVPAGDAPTVREVARRVGYRQPAQFAKAFRRHLGHAPSDHRSAANGSAPRLQQAA